MRKIAFLLGLVVMTTSLAFAQSNYTAESDGTYTYMGTPVNELVVDFATWSTSDLPTPLSDDMVAAESHNMAFVKWKIQSRNCGDKGNVNALFNNDYGDFSEGGASVRNNATTNKPRIFLPTTAYGVNSIKISGSVNSQNNQSVGVFYKDASQSTWKWKGNLTLSSTYAEVSLELNTVGQTSIYLSYDKTPYITIGDLELEIETPEASQYQLESDGKYTYIGDPVESLSVDFTTWQTTDLPSTFTDDMVAAEKDGMAFVKWKITPRNLGGDKGTVNALFNNNAADFGGSPTNTATTNKPRIYLPTTSTGVTNIRVHGMGNVTLGVYYKDVKQSTWKWVGSISLPASYGEANCALNTNGKTSIYLEYGNTPYPTITDITLDTKYIKNTTTNLYEYQGEPVEEINIDFSNTSQWWPSLLPSLSDEMPIEERYGLGFVKWKINSNGGSYWLFNNDNTDWSGTAETKNNATTNPPTIYFPTTLRGVVSVAITYTGGNNFVMKGTYTDAIQTHSENIEFPAASTPNTVVWNLSSAGQTKVYLQYFGAVWPRIRSIVFTIKATEAEPLVLWAKADSHGNTNRIEEANGEERDVYLKRAFTADGNYYTLCLPFDLTAEQVTAAFGSCTLAKLTSSEMNGDEINLNFADDITSIEAGVPYLFLPTADIESCYFPAVTINADASRVINTTYFKMTGIYNPTVLTNEDYFMGTDNYLVQVTDENPLLPFRAYFSLANGGSLSAPARVVFHHSGTTGLENTQKAAEGIRKIFRDGHMFIQRGETVYTINGQMVK